MPLRRRTIDRLKLRAGDTVLDVACGTGLSFDLLHDAVGDSGHIIGVELSPEMIELARRRVAEAGWKNVTLIESDMASVVLSHQLDAILFNFTHDVLRSKPALANIFASARGGARVALAGMKYPPRWMAPVNYVVRAQARPYMTTFEGLAAPWDLATDYLQSFERESALFGTAYIGWGRVSMLDHFKS
jgi:demethylmenaquinone methyltransferase/2-methoxy-6-polyprenyl-1,4-benzoquinol methylase